MRCYFQNTFASFRHFHWCNLFSDVAKSCVPEFTSSHVFTLLCISQGKKYYLGYSSCCGATKAA